MRTDELNGALVPRIGIVGGLGPESTIDHYRRILELWHSEDPSTAPSIVIDILDVGLALRLVEKDRPALIEYLSASLHRLAGAGASFIAMTANTPHIVFDELVERSTVPLLSIVEVCAEEAHRRGDGSPAPARDAIHDGGTVLSDGVRPPPARRDRLGEGAA